MCCEFHIGLNWVEKRFSCKKKCNHIVEKKIEKNPKNIQKIKIEGKNLNKKKIKKSKNPKKSKKHKKSKPNKN